MTAGVHVPLRREGAPAAHGRGRRVALAALTVAALLGAWAVVATPTGRDSVPPPPATVPPSRQHRLAGRDLYVAADGLDTNPGTATRPYRTIDRADEHARPGTTVHVAPGRYPAVTTRSSGTSGAPIRYVSQVPGGAVIATGDTTPWTNEGDHVDVVGFDVSAPGARAGLISFGSHVAFVANRVHDVATTVACTSLGGGGIVHGEYRGSSDNVVQGNWVRDVGPRGGCATLQGIYVAQPGAVVVDNVVSRVSAWCIHTWHAATRVTIANNLVFDCGTGSTGGGIVIGAGDRPGGVSAGGCTVTNNLVLDSVHAISEVGRIGTGNRYVSNLLAGNATNQISLLRGVQRGTVFAMPRFVRFAADGTGDYRLQAGSPGVDAGTTLGAPSTDIAGTPRPQGAAPDIGPYER